MYLGEYRIDDYVTLVATTHRFSSGAAYAPTSITYRVYEDATNIEIVIDTAMTNFNAETGFYLDRIQCTAAIGYETGKTYTALIKATVDGVAAITAYTWRILTSPVNVTQLLGTAWLTPAVAGTPDVNAKQIGGTAQTGNDVGADVDAILVDTIEIGVAGAGLTAINLPDQTMNITGNLSGSVGSVTGAVNNVTTGVTVTTNNDKTGYAIGVGGIASTAFAAGAIDAAALAADATTEITAGIRIKKNTVLNNFMFLMVDSTDHVTPKTGLTITATRSIDAAVFAACANVATEVANGMYKINFAATDVNGDVITFKFAGTGADDRLITIVTTT